MITLDKNVGGYLQKAFAEGFAVHAYVVQGEKHRLSSLLTQCALVTLCPNHCNDGCEVCNKVLTNAHQDVIKLPREDRSRLKVEDISFLVEESSLRPVDNSQARVFLIDASSSTAGMGSDLWQNKLLKTIEEPLADIYVFIGVTDYESLLPTVRSRCQLLKQSVLSTEQVCQAMIQKGFDLKTCQISAVMSNGSIDTAEKLIADNGAFDAFKTAMDMLENMLSTKMALPYVTQIVNNKQNVNNCLGFLTVLLGESIRYRLAPQLCQLSSLKRTIDKICSNYTLQAARVCIEKINVAKKNIDDGCNLTLVIDTLGNAILEVRFRCQL